MVSNANVEPRFIRQSTPDQKAVAYTALKGMRCVPSIRESQALKGKPRSREKAKTSRDVVASVVMLPAEIRISRMMVRASAILVEPVLRNNWRYGTSAASASSRLPIQKSIVISMIIPRVTFMRKDHHITRGTVREASETSSDMWTALSLPVTHISIREKSR